MVRRTSFSIAGADTRRGLSVLLTGFRSGVLPASAREK
jgi:hypothetical protein